MHQGRGVIFVILLVCMQAIGATKYPGDAILQYASEITITPDARVTVTESITATCAGEYRYGGYGRYRNRIPTIVHGLYREIRTYTHTPLGLHHVTPVTMLTVTRDGAPEPYQVQKTLDGVCVSTGDPRKVLYGVHTFTISYRIDQLLTYRGNEAILDWDVTTDQWGFPIEETSATFTLPAANLPPTAVRVTATAATGTTLTSDSPNRYHLRTNGVLPPHKGLRCTIRFLRGIMTTPANAVIRRQLLRENPILLFGPLTIALSLLVYFLLWFLVGRDPCKSTVIPRATPPQGFSPAAVRYLWREGFDFLTFTTALTDLAVKGLICIREDGDTYTICREEDTTGGTLREQLEYLETPDGQKAHLTLEERHLAETLLWHNPTFTFKSENREDVKAACKRVKLRLANQCQGVYFHSNLLCSLLGIGFTTVLMLIVAYQELLHGYRGDLLRFFAGILLLGGVFPIAVQTLRPMWHEVCTNPVEQFRNAYLTLIQTAGLIGLGGLGVYLLRDASFLLILLAIVLATISTLFAFLLKAMTVKGRRIRDELEGFRLYLSGETSVAWCTQYAPELTPQLFERYLPYAMALDVAPAWGRQCTEALTRIRANGAFYLPGWYYGLSWNHGGIQQLIKSLCQTLPSAIDASTKQSGQELIEGAKRAHAHGTGGGAGYGGGSGAGCGGGSGGGW